MRTGQKSQQKLRMKRHLKVCHARPCSRLAQVGSSSGTPAPPSNSASKHPSDCCRSEIALLGNLHDVARTRRYVPLTVSYLTGPIAEHKPIGGQPTQAKPRCRKACAHHNKQQTTTKAKHLDNVWMMHENIATPWCTACGVDFQSRVRSNTQ